MAGHYHAEARQPQIMLMYLQNEIVWFAQNVTVSELNCGGHGLAQPEAYK